MISWQVWTEGTSREDAAVIAARFPRDAASKFAATHSRIETSYSFEVFVSETGSDVVRTFEFTSRIYDAQPAHRGPRGIIERIDEEIRRAKRLVARREEELSEARERLAEHLASRERWLVMFTQAERDEALLARADSDDALRRPSNPDAPTRRREAAGE